MAPSSSFQVVTGAFGYSGKYIAARLLAAGVQVRTLTDSPHRPNPFGGKIEVHPYNFDCPEQLVESLRGAKVLYNTYWVRFNHRDFQHAGAVENTLKLIEAAVQAGVQRVVHVSITNPSEDSPLEYFRDKARLERALRESGLSYSILRPAILFGREDILINNIAWGLRRFPVFGLFGDGQYRLQPVFVDDFAELAIQQGQGATHSVINAIGPESFSYAELVKHIGVIIGCPRPLIRLPPSIAYGFARIAGVVLGDVMITRAEIEGLMSGLLYVDASPAGTTLLTHWAKDHADSLGKCYASELARRKYRDRDYTTQANP